jgi:hypothetical protein
MSFLDRLDGFAKRIERFLSGNAAADPLYITNRTVGQKVRLGLLIGTPALAVAGLMALALNSYFDPAPSEPKVEAAPKTREITAKVLPATQKEFSPETSREVDVVEAAITHSSGATLAGKLRNNTDHLVRAADVVFDVTDSEGSQLGGVAVRVENIAAKSTAPFQVTLEQRAARSALVREIHSR